jgi:hypothetical protein
MFALSDSVLTITKGLILPDGTSAVPAGPTIRMLSHTDITFDPGGEATYINGAGVLPIAIVIGTSKPKLEIDFSNGPELWSARQRIGGIGSTILISLSFTRPGSALTPTTFVFAPATWMNGGGIALNAANGSKPDKLSVMCTNALQDQRSIYNQFA